MTFPANLVQKFNEVFEQAKAEVRGDPTAVALATVDLTGQPRVRTVLLKDVSDAGFMFVTNRQSIKGQHLLGNPKCGLCFYWHEIGQQIVVEGTVTLASVEVSNQYWKTRPRESQLGAWASMQSSPLQVRGELEEAYAKYENQFAGEEIPRPDYWGGYWVVPSKIEFWRTVAGRMHHRLQYKINANAMWEESILSP